MRAALLMVLATVFATGCESTSSSWKRKLDSPLGVERAEGVMMIDAAKDWSAVPLLIDTLEDDDVSVRVLAVQTLRRMTERKFKFLPYGPERERRQGVRRWRGWWSAEGKFLKTSGGSQAGGAS